MGAKGRQETLERQARILIAREAEKRLAALIACLDSARETMQRVTETRAKAQDLALVRSPLDSAETAFKKAREGLAQENPQQALGRLDTAQADCQSAQEAGANVLAKFSKSKTTSTKDRRQR